MADPRRDPRDPPGQPSGGCVGTYLQERGPRGLVGLLEQDRTRKKSPPGQMPLSLKELEDFLIIECYNVLMVKASKQSRKSKGIQSNEPRVATTQWMTYVFWAGAAIAGSVLVGISTSLVVDGYGQGMSSALYAVIALAIILPIAVISDRVYSKDERSQKVGIGLVLMVLHAVIFAIVAVGALATAIYSLTQHLLFPTGTNELLTVTATAGWLALTFALIVVRTVKVSFARMAKILLLVLTVSTFFWGVLGPVTQSVMRRDDDQSERAFQNLYSMVTIQAGETGKLPADIDAAIDVQTSKYMLNETAVLKKSADAGLISYIPNTKEPTTVKEDGSVITTHYFQMCVTYKYDNKNRDNWGGIYIDSVSSSDGNHSSLYTGTSPDAGSHCYQYTATSSI